MTFVEKYRPKKLDEIIGQDKIIKVVRDILEKDDIPHMLFVGPPGVGKTTMAECIANELFGPEKKFRFIELNASDERGIDVIRNKIKKIVSIPGRRIILLDEADALTQDAQQALRRIMEKSNDTIFILTCNFENKIIDPIKSRCLRLEFEPIKYEDIVKLLVNILEKENIKVEQNEDTIKALRTIVELSKGDLRKCLNLLEQIISSNKEITPENVLYYKKPNKMKNILKIVLGGDFKTGRDMITYEYNSYRYNLDELIEEILKGIEDLDEEDFIKIKLIEKVSDLEYRIKVGSDPYIQLIGFLSFVWIIKYTKHCPLMKR